MLGATNTYLGPTTIEGGTLQLGAPQVLPPASTLVLAGGDTRTSSYTGGYDTYGPDVCHRRLQPNAGAAALDGAVHQWSYTIDFGPGASALAFADSHPQNWKGIPLTIVNYTPGVASLRFGTSSAGLTSTQLGLSSSSL